MSINKTELFKSEKDYQTALARFEVIFQAKKGTTESDEADQLATMIQEYENTFLKEESPSAITSIE